MDAVEISSYGSPPPPYPNVQTVQPGVSHFIVYECLRLVPIAVHVNITCYAYKLA